MPNKDYLYKHEPVCFNSKPLLKNNLWNFTLGFDGLMHNTQCPSFVLPFDAETFTVVFDFNDMEKRTWSDTYSTYDKNDVFVEGSDVFSGKVSPSKMTYCWVRKSAEPENMNLLKHLYTNMMYYKQQYESALTKYEKQKSKVAHNELFAEQTVEEYLAQVTQN